MSFRAGCSDLAPRAKGVTDSSRFLRGKRSSGDADNFLKLWGLAQWMWRSFLDI